MKLLFYSIAAKVKWSRYRPGVAQRVGGGIALLFHDRGARRGWVVSSMPWPHFTPGKDPVPILQETGWAPGPVWTGGKSHPHRDSIPDRPARSQSLYRLSYRPTLRICNIYFFPTATMVARTRLNITLYLYCLSCVSCFWNQIAGHIANVEGVVFSSSLFCIITVRWLFSPTHGQ